MIACLYWAGFYFIRLLMMLMQSAITNVFNRKANKPCSKTSLLNFLPVISTSDTWKVQPITNEK